MARTDFKGVGLLSIVRKATAAITNNPPAGRTGGGLFVKLDTDTDYFVLCGAGEAPRGIVDSNVLAGADATIREDGEWLIKLGGTVTLTAGFAAVEVGSGGTAVALASGVFAGLVTKAGVSGDWVPIRLASAIERYLSV